MTQYTMRRVKYFSDSRQKIGVGIGLLKTSTKLFRATLDHADPLQ